MSEAKLDWSTAKVKDAKLTVGIAGDIPPGWKDSFDTTARLLGRSGDWGEVSMKGKKGVTVVGVTPGLEDRLRHFLESVVEQSNADHRQDDEDEEPRDDDEQDESDDGDAGPDAEMSDRFRSFAD
jgi:hypothetical protein